MKIEYLIALFFILLWLFFMLRKRISEEHRLIKQTEAAILIDELIDASFEPLTRKENIHALEKHISEMNAIQERISKSLIAKRFVDYRESIASKQIHLEEMKKGKDQYHFITSILHSVKADLVFKKEQLIKLAKIVDETFIWDDASATFNLNSQNQQLSLNMTLYENIELDKEECQEFINRVSKEVFEGKHISFQISYSEPEREEFYDSVK